MASMVSQIINKFLF